MADRTDVSDAELLARFASLASPLEIFFSRRLDTHADVEDLISEVKVRLLASLRLNHGIADVGRFAFGIAKNVLREYRRADRRRDWRTLDDLVAAGREPAAPPATREAEGDLFADAEDTVLALRECLAQLSPTDRRLITDYYASDDQDAHRAHLAEAAGVSSNAIYIRVSRIRRRLRECSVNALASLRRV